MAHTKSQGAAKRTVNVPGKRRGVKKFGGEKVKNGNIIVRQLGTKFYPGANTSIGKDFTIYAVAKGTVSFRMKRINKKHKNFVDVITEEKKTTKRKR